MRDEDAVDLLRLVFAAPAEAVREVTGEKLGIAAVDQDNPTLGRLYNGGVSLLYVDEIDPEDAAILLFDHDVLGLYAARLGRHDEARCGHRLYHPVVLFPVFHRDDLDVRISDVLDLDPVAPLQGPNEPLLGLRLVNPSQIDVDNMLHGHSITSRSSRALVTVSGYQPSSSKCIKFLRLLQLPPHPNPAPTSASIRGCSRLKKPVRAYPSKIFLHHWRDCMSCWTSPRSARCCCWSIHRCRCHLKSLNIHPQLPLRAQHKLLALILQVTGGYLKGWVKGPTSVVQGIAQVVGCLTNIQLQPEQVHHPLPVHAMIWGKGKQLHQACGLLESPVGFSDDPLGSTETWNLPSSWMHTSSDSSPRPVRGSTLRLSFLRVHYEDLRRRYRS